MDFDGSSYSEDRCELCPSAKWYTQIMQIM